ncbi:hypothetical protein BGX23_010758, partial [Mortierella sp. AD031]
HVRFNIDDTFRYDHESSNDGMAEHSTDAAQSAIQFIKEHTRQFEGRLKTAYVCDSGSWPHNSWHCPSEFQTKLARALPPLHKPTTLSPANWMQFSAHPLSTDLGHSKTVSNGPLRRRGCRIDIISLLSAAIMDDKGAVLQKTARSPRLLLKQQHGLVPITSVYIRITEDFGSAENIDDIAFGFSQTLETLTVNF